MNDVMVVLHVLLAVFAVGPMAVLPMTALRAVRAGDGPQVASQARSTFVFSLITLAVVIFGFGAMGTAPDAWDLSFGDLWIWLSIVLYVIALGLTLGLVVPGLRGAADALKAGAGSAKDAYGKVAAANGVASLLLVVVVVLMVVKP